MGKYARLKMFLQEQGRDRVPMTFAEIEQILGLSLPASKCYPAWWSNNPSNNPMTREWLAAGFETESVNVADEKLTFRRVRERLAVDREGSPKQPSSRSGRRSEFGFMKGLLTIEEGYDLTTPSDEAWDRFYTGLEEKRG